ncbi:GNAT family N-acetyltransferase [Lacrimispora defluvii]|uniref:GNAT family N-acetyltransferase n=1 Tax=Lacrimispora defluvii TaxID=2719233 RepID=A0ABX1VZ93_9FIRM|nr:GNAT family N-acetyltransferase [Lacrimispora defluvii]NNJ31786.1 GNAT family N-acetyltransferase [Lacrimispora defluvii]
MNLIIKKLNSELGETFVNFLSSIDFQNTPHWATCYCRYYQSDCSMEEWKNRSGETNRDEALTEILNGRMTGYLAFDNDKCIGWCNSNDITNYSRLKDELYPYCGDKKVGCTICFMIHPEYRGQGIARQILKTAISDFVAEGYDAMIALPFEDQLAPQKRYRGTKNMYECFGYRVIDQEDTVSVMWLDLENYR